MDEPVRRVLWVSHISPGSLGQWYDCDGRQKMTQQSINYAAQCAVAEHRVSHHVWGDGLQLLPCPEEDIPDSLSLVTMTREIWSMSSAINQQWVSLCTWWRIDWAVSFLTIASITVLMNWCCNLKMRRTRLVGGWMTSEVSSCHIHAGVTCLCNPTHCDPHGVIKTDLLYRGDTQYGDSGNL